MTRGAQLFEFFRIRLANVVAMTSLAPFERLGHVWKRRARLVQSAQIHERRLAAFELTSDPFDVRQRSQVRTAQGVANLCIGDEFVHDIVSRGDFVNVHERLLQPSREQTAPHRRSALVQ